MTASTACSAKKRVKNLDRKSDNQHPPAQSPISYPEFRANHVPAPGLRDTKDTNLKPAPTVYVRYFDHVHYHQTDPILMKPQMREAMGWLVYETSDYIIVCWDRDADPPTLKGGDPKASGLVLLRTDILELRRID